jgi:hypothetical protein
LGGFRGTSKHAWSADCREQQGELLTGCPAEAWAGSVVELLGDLSELLVVAFDLAAGWSRGYGPAGLRRRGCSLGMVLIGDGDSFVLRQNRSAIGTDVMIGAQARVLPSGFLTVRP